MGLFLLNHSLMADWNCVLCGPSMILLELKILIIHWVSVGVVVTTRRGSMMITGA